MAKRTLIVRKRRFYVVRRKDGTFKSWTAVGKSLKADRRVKAKTIVKSGYGHRGDHKRRS